MEPEESAKSSDDLRVLIVADHASAKFGGEAILPLHYFRQLRRRQIEAWLVVHSRTRSELSAIIPTEIERIFFVRDTWLHILLAWLAEIIPGRLAEHALAFPLQLLTQFQQRPVIQRLVRDKRISVIHQPTPVSPKMPSAMFGLGAPVIIGPMNGGMHDARKPGELRFSRALADLINRAIPGKIYATTLLVANDRTRGALPSGVRGTVYELVENGVDLSLWTTGVSATVRDGSPFYILYVGRLVDWKCVDLLLEAFKPVAESVPARLTIVGDGPERARLMAKLEELGIRDGVTFAGFMPQAACAEQMRQAHVLVLPSMRECGGAVVLEAMATGLPVIATNWGGPSDYLDAESGILVDPLPHANFVRGLTSAMLRLAQNEPARRQMGENARRRVIEKFDWERKIAFILDVYREAMRRFSTVAPIPRESTLNGGGRRWSRLGPHR